MEQTSEHGHAKFPSSTVWLTQDNLKAYLTYHPELGTFTRNSDERTLDSLVKGYTIITIGGYAFRAGRLAWFYMKGVWPIEIDHEDLNKANDIWSNLREATRSQNCANRESFSTLGIKGVQQLPSGRYSATIRKNHINTYLGSYDTAEEASQAYKEAATRYHGEFANT